MHIDPTTQTVTVFSGDSYNFSDLVDHDNDHTTPPEVIYEWHNWIETSFHGIKFHIPTRRDIDARLVLGAALFGAGWGIAGVCPGPGLTSSVTGAETSLVFVSAMLVGMYGYQRVFSPARAVPQPQVAK